MQETLFEKQKDGFQSPEKKQSYFLNEEHDGFVLSFSSQEPSASPPSPNTCSAIPLGNKDTSSSITLLRQTDKGQVESG